MNKGIIYMIRSLNSNHIYIGSTIQSLSIRKSKHMYDSKKPLRSKPIHKFVNDNDGWDNFVMEKLNCLDCNLNRAMDYNIYKKANVKEYECECGAVFSITPYDKDKKLFTLEKHYKTLCHRRYEMLNEDIDDIDFNLFTIIELRKIIVYNKKEDGTYYVRGCASKIKK